mmetsp:Transcript_11232/g.34759  ORF Transcript_11232/g.34759 Transcript_11232/m.34759 type:complete len:265 (+) Transcript_11232:504-1298(+)
MRATWLRMRTACTEREVTVCGSLGAFSLGWPPRRPSDSRMERSTLTTPKSSVRRRTRSTAAAGSSSPDAAAPPAAPSPASRSSGWYSLTRLPRNPAARRSRSGTGEAPSKSRMPRTSARPIRSRSLSERPESRRWATRRCFRPPSGSGCLTCRESMWSTCGRKRTATLCASGSGEAVQKWASRQASARSAKGSTLFVSSKKMRTSGCLLMSPSHFRDPNRALLIWRQAGGRLCSPGRKSMPMESLILEQISNTLLAQPIFKTRA